MSQKPDSKCSIVVDHFEDNDYAEGWYVTVHGPGHCCWQGPYDSPYLALFRGVSRVLEATKPVETE